MSLPRLIVQFVLIAFSCFTLKAQAYDESDDNQAIYVSPYPFPIENPLIATVTTAFMFKVSKPPIYKIMPVILFPERAKLKRFGNKNYLQIVFFKHKENPSAPLIFLIPGIGGNSINPKTVFIAELLYRAGFNVVTMPATMSWQFTLGVSKTGYPGYSPRDAEDMLDLMKFVDSKLRREEQISPSKYALMGYSLGALDSGFIAKLDLEKHFFNFNRVLMVNPPLQKVKSIRALDGLLQNRSWRSLAEPLESDTAATNRIMEFQNYSFEDLLKFDFNRRLGVAEQDLAWLIGANFRRALREVILASQDVYELKFSRSHSRNRLPTIGSTEAFKYSFRDYLDQILFKEVNSEDNNSVRFRTSDDLIETSDLHEVLPLLSARLDRWAVFHNSDDFIFHNGDLNYLLQSKSASRIYPLGGHVGNFWFKQNQNDIVRFFKPLIED